VPWLSAGSSRRAAGTDLPRAALYLNVSATLWILVALGYLVVRLDGETLADVFVRGPETGASSRPWVAWTAGITVAGLGLVAAGHLLRHRLGLPSEGGILSRLRPRTAGEMILVALIVSPTAGVCEEFLYRGFLLSRLVMLIPSLTAAGAGAALLFAAAHIYQGWFGAVRAGLIALLLAAPPVMLGSIVPSMAAHALIDAAGLLLVWPWLDRAWPAPAPEAGNAAEGHR
jgi:membrane protease YdiL (CAAX protease family)